VNAALIVGISRYLDYPWFLIFPNTSPLHYCGKSGIHSFFYVYIYLHVSGKYVLVEMDGYISEVFSNSFKFNIAISKLYSPVCSTSFKDH
jgi:hypothetical protein